MCVAELLLAAWHPSWRAEYLDGLLDDVLDVGLTGPGAGPSNRPQDRLRAGHHRCCRRTWRDTVHRPRGDIRTQRTTSTTKTAVTMITMKRARSARTTTTTIRTTLSTRITTGEVGGEGLWGHGGGPDLHRRSAADDLDVPGHQLVEVTGVSLETEQEAVSQHNTTQHNRSPQSNKQ